MDSVGRRPDRDAPERRQGLEGDGEHQPRHPSCSLLGDGLGGPSSHRALPLRRRVAEVRSELTEHRDEFRSSGLDGLKRLLDLWIQTHGWRLSFGPSLSSAWE